jgi:hypothetical protein
MIRTPGTSGASGAFSAGPSLLPAMTLSGLTRWALWVEYIALGGNTPSTT